MAEKSKGLAGKPASGRELALLCADGDSPDDDSEFAILFSVEPDFSSEKDTIHVTTIIHECKAIIILLLHKQNDKKSLIQTSISKLLDSKKLIGF